MCLIFSAGDKEKSFVASLLSDQSSIVLREELGSERENIPLITQSAASTRLY